MNKEELFNRLNIKPISIKRKGKVTIITTPEKKYVLYSEPNDE